MKDKQKLSLQQEVAALAFLIAGVENYNTPDKIFVWYLLGLAWERNKKEGLLPNELEAVSLLLNVTDEGLPALRKKMEQEKILAPQDAEEKDLWKQGQDCEQIFIRNQALTKKVAALDEQLNEYRSMGLRN